MTLKRTTDRLPAKRYGVGGRVRFDEGQRETDAYDDSTEQWAVEMFDELIRADDGEEDSKSLEEEAAEVVTERDHPR